MGIAKVNPDDLLGKTYDQITVRSVERRDGYWWYHVDCTCGGTACYRRDTLLGAGRSSCGCGMIRNRAKIKRRWGRTQLA